MKCLLLLLPILISVNIFEFTKGDSSMKAQESISAIAAKKFAVLELFTSEGCSSCPPADALLAKLQKEYKDKPVYFLAFHVDYWDRLGWKDAFSNHSFSVRQSAYGDLFHLSSIYTPQMVINGKVEAVGSDEQKIESAIADALTTENTTALTLLPKRTDDNLTLDYQVSKFDKPGQLLVALVRKSATSIVLRGENKGRTLSHVQIVHSLENYPLSACLIRQSMCWRDHKKLNLHYFCSSNFI